MKKIWILMVCIVMISVSCVSLCSASRENAILPEYEYLLSGYEYYAIPEWNIMIVTPEDVICVDEGDGYYLYVEEEGYIPFVMVTVYDEYDSEEDFFDEFTEYLESLYDDLEMTYEEPYFEVDGKYFYEVDYAYTVEDVQVKNRCLAKVFNGYTYMFTSKEVPELDLMVYDLLEMVAAESCFLVDGQPVIYNITELTWESIEDYVSDYVDGDFVSIPQTDLEMFIPSDFTEVPLTQEDVDDYFIYVAESETGLMTAQKIPVDEDVYLYDYMEYLSDEEDVDYIEMYLVNGILFFKYEMPDSELLTIETRAGSEVIDLTFSPVSDDAMIEYMAIMVSSLMQTGTR